MKNFKQLVAIGAGPKALAVAAKLTVLEELGITAAPLTIIEKQEVGANWSGSCGYTNGNGLLGTSPEKDVGFPYQSQLFDDETDKLIDQHLQRFSWNAYLVEQKRFADWIDRGRPAPRHREWTAYLKWVREQLSPSINFIQGEVKRLKLGQRGWLVFYSADGNTFCTLAGALLFTGPGRQNDLFPEFASDRLLNAATFWQKIPFLAAAKGARKIAIIGGGETAASVADALLTSYGENFCIDIITPEATVYSRGESYFESRIYTNPDCCRWHDLTLAQRQEFIRRTDRGVFSPDILNKLSFHSNVSIISARCHDIAENEDASIRLRGNSGHRNFDGSYDWVITAVGGDLAAHIKDLLDSDSLVFLKNSLGIKHFSRSELELLIDKDLSLDINGFKLFVPGLAAVNQGPGFANLSNLGRIADRVIKPFLTKEGCYESGANKTIAAERCVSFASLAGGRLQKNSWFHS